MEVFIIYRQGKKSFGRLGPKEVFSVYADVLEAQDCVDSLSDSKYSRFTIEVRHVVYAHRILNKAREETALEMLSDYGKRLLGLCE